MSNSERPKTLLRAANDTLRVYAAAAVLSLLLIIFIPSWIRWLWFTLSGLVLLVSILANFVEDWKPKSRVPVNSKAVVITGCDSGFGHDLAQRLDDLGLQVFAGCLNPEGEGAKNLKKSASAKLQVLPLDVSSEESVDKFHKQVVQKIKDNKLWAVVCNAGMNDGAEIFWTNTDIIQRVIDVNTFGVVRVTKAFLPQLCKSKGRVVTVCSAASLYTYAGMVPYCMSKHAAKSFCDGLRLEMYRFGVKVVTIDPWMYKTNITKEDFTVKYITKTWEQAPAEIKEFYPEEYFQRYKKVIIRFLNYAISDKPQQVIDCLEEAVMALSPKYSYNPGTVYSRLSFWLIRRLPKQLADFILHEEFATKC
ncbi:short-chain dehydrogenase/reductase family 9C member 7-like [Argiope bruennichi]|uniref:short-chain dehydrogenase/reductase family 9C member 7-like n=1 Tax=Argiope bruennichi TaxID=94029 RepID=UPI0024940C43|nr:short-chain dehydrogenase/reductase family 9C member 7-like [Argiope bruennichi]